MVRPRGNRGHRSETERTAHRVRVAKLTLQGYNQTQIGEVLEVDRSTVSRDLKAIREDWKNSTSHDVTVERSQFLAKLRLIQAEGWRAWEESRIEKVILIDSRREEGGEPATQEERDEPPQGYRRVVINPGNVGYLRTVFDAVKEEGAVLGLYPRKDEKPIEPPPEVEDIDLTTLTFKDLVKVARGDKEPLRNASKK